MRNNYFIPASDKNYFQLHDNRSMLCIFSEHPGSELMTSAVLCKNSPRNVIKDFHAWLM